MILWDEMMRFMENEKVKCERTIKAWGRDSYGRPRHDTLHNLEAAENRKLDIEETVRMLSNAKFIYDRRNP